jgi:hypothetical protein
MTTPWPKACTASTNRAHRAAGTLAVARPGRTGYCRVGRLVQTGGACTAPSATSRRPSSRRSTGAGWRRRMPPELSTVPSAQVPADLPPDWRGSWASQRLAFPRHRVGRVKHSPLGCQGCHHRRHPSPSPTAEIQAAESPENSGRFITAAGLRLGPHRLDVDGRLYNVILPDRCNQESTQPQDTGKGCWRS